MSNALNALTPERLLIGYCNGIFPMSEARDDPEIFWVEPRMRGVIPLDGFHISKSLKKTLNRGTFSVTWDTCFADVVRHCAARDETWINDTIYDLSCAVFEQGDGHSVEVWQDNVLVGGVYGFVIGAAFFGESMFSTATDASKVALAYLTDRLRQNGFTLFDTQFITPHLASMGAIEIPQEEYLVSLRGAIALGASWDTSERQTAQGVIQRNAQIS